MHCEDATVPNVTLTILPVSLALVHIPRHRLRHFSHSIIQQILLPAPTFLNISCNATEVSIFAEKESVAPFVKAAKRDWKRIERRKRKAAVDGTAKLRTRTRTREVAPIQVSSTWSALQIDSHGDQIGDASARIREISALLSGISILYQSSYSTDFIFVQSARLPRVIAILTDANFLPRSSSYNPYSHSTAHRTPYSPSPSSSSSLRDSYLADDDEDDGCDRRGRGRRVRRDTVASSRTADSIHSAMTSKLRPPGTEDHDPTNSTVHRPYSFSRGRRPKVTVLPSDLVVVGLSEESDAWATKLIRLLLFSEDVQQAAAERALHPDIRRERVGGRYDIKVAPSSDAGLGLDTGGDDDDDAESFHSLEDEGEDGGGLPSSSYSSGSSSSESESTSPAPSSSQPSQPFFSLTRTTASQYYCTSSSGPTTSSLTTDIHLLAAVFPPNERHWIFCSDEFERLGERADGNDSSEDEDVGFPPSPARSEGGSLRCLHVDLREYGLDRHGLIDRFAALLHAENIHHLYSSTFKTANLLVSERDAARALEVLSKC